MFPLAAPGLMTVAIFDFLSLWNEYFLALIFLTSRDLYTVPLGMYRLASTLMGTSAFSGVMAGFIIMMIPVLIVFIILEKRVVAGLTMGALKQ
jgi:ABC-type glycerol-3-phosphate transport system permease component